MQVEVNRQSVAGVLLARAPPVVHTAEMSKRDDFADKVCDAEAVKQSTV